MPIITPADLYTHMYPEMVDEITRGDNSITEHAIAAAVAEVKLYLSRYDLALLFGGDKSSPVVNDPFLQVLVKNIACWQLLQLANPAADDRRFRNLYEDAINTLKGVLEGKLQPESWPYKTIADDTLPDGNSIAWSSEQKRTNYY